MLKIFQDLIGFFYLQHYLGSLHCRQLLYNNLMLHCFWSSMAKKDRNFAEKCLAKDTLLCWLHPKPFLMACWTRHACKNGRKYCTLDVLSHSVGIEDQWSSILFYNRSVRISMEVIKCNNSYISTLNLTYFMPFIFMHV